MQVTVFFPGLGIHFDINRVAFTLFGMPVYWYGVLIGLGVFLAIAFALNQARSFGIDPDRMIDVIVIGLILGVIGARLYYVLFVSVIEYTSFWQLINLRDGGLAIYGGIIFGFLGALLGCKLRKVPLLPMFDVTAMGFLIGQCIGRWGNFFNQEAFGTNTILPWGMLSSSTTAYLGAQQEALALEGVFVDPNLPVHPTFLYESLWCALGFFLLLAWKKRRHFNGELFLFYVIWYGVGRFFIEGLRTDSLMVFGLRVSQVVAAVSVLAAVAVWVAVRMRTAGKPLQVPALPPRSEKIKLQTEEGMVTVEVTWSGDEKRPSKERLQEMAREKWEGENPPKEETASDEKTGEDPLEAEEGESEIKGEGNPAP
ncbi:prolipoprotein diacylglyceryl transferase [Ruminococcaceae bacterium OttesenSCG-928-I18]|nr:prolipoprotein diacylglyceryl transferase [Ruminococcaceae bacterium OttesenSCG-928-I18]